MYTDNELQISNKSYTSKDFQSIFPELLDTVKKMTNKWDPSTSNESDPGVVLLKLGALLADKNNYNIDKNVLETFPLSVTQRANAMKIYDMLGYQMGWYNAATTDITVTYTGGKDTINNGAIVIPKYTMFTDDSGQMVYTLIDDLTINEPSIPQSGEAMQGVIHDYEVNGVVDITLDNLDSELRLFFTDKNVAQNGIFVYNKGTVQGDWRRVTNLESQPLSSYIYKFGIMPNTDACYIQFPQDIGSLIGGGLNIKYITTSGVAGNVGANTINSFYGNFVPANYTESINDRCIVKNSASTSSGSDPEDIDEAYRNYKRTIGTFDTLVTLRDYENAIYSADDGYGKKYVSNVVVSDRTCDINYTTRVIELTTEGNQECLYESMNSDVPYMDAFDVGLYVLNPMAAIYDSEYYFNKSFSPIQDQSDIQAKIDDYRVSSHNYIKQEDGNPYIYKNFYTLVGKVITYYKVTKAQAYEIEDNIKKALFKRYNARNVEFGQPVNYDDIVSTVQKADTRIKTVLLAEPQYELRYTTSQDMTGKYQDSYPLTESLLADGGQMKNDTLIKLLARMVLSGNVQLYKFDRDVVYRFGQTNIQKYPRIEKITPKIAFSSSAMESIAGEAPSLDPDVGGGGEGGSGDTPSTPGGTPIIPGENDSYGDDAYTDSTDSEGYEIQKNQNIQLFAPNLFTQKAYTSYVNYCLEDSAASYKSNAVYSSGSWSVSIGDETYAIDVSYQDGAISGMTVDGNNVQFDQNQDLDNFVSGSFSLTIDGQSTLIHMLAKMDQDDTIESIKFSWGDGSFIVPQGSYYRLKPTQQIRINYTDSNDVVHNEVIEGGTIIKFTDSNDATTVLSTTKSVIERNGIGYSTLTSSQQIDVLAVNKQTKDDKKLYCMWFTNDYTKLQQEGTETDTILYTLFKAGQTQRMLQDNEYFIYTNQDKNELIILGSGTIIQRQNGQNSLSTSIKVGISNVISDGISAIDNDTDWFQYNAYANKLTFVETQVVTLGEGAIVKADVMASDYSNLSYGNPVRVKNVMYKDNSSVDGFTPLVSFDVGGDSMYQGVYCGWTLSTKLNLMSGQDYPQQLPVGTQLELYATDSLGRQVVYSPYVDSSGTTINNSLLGGDTTEIVSNTTLAFSGSDQISVASSDESDINIYRYNKANVPSIVKQGVGQDVTISYYDFRDNESGGNNDQPINLKFGFGYDVIDNASQKSGSSLSYTNRQYLIPISLIGDKTQVDVAVILRELHLKLPENDTLYVPLGSPPKNGDAFYIDGVLYNKDKGLKLRFKNCSLEYDGSAWIDPVDYDTLPADVAYNTINISTISRVDTPQDSKQLNLICGLSEDQKKLATDWGIAYQFLSGSGLGVTLNGSAISDSVIKFPNDIFVDINSTPSIGDKLLIDGTFYAIDGSKGVVLVFDECLMEFGGTEWKQVPYRNYNNIPSDVEYQYHTISKISAANSQTGQSPALYVGLDGIDTDISSFVGDWNSIYEFASGSGAGINFSGQQLIGNEVVVDSSAVTLDKDNSIYFLKYTDSGFSDRFAGIQISNWISSIAGDERKDYQDFLRIDGIFVSPAYSDAVSYSDIYGEQLYKTVERYYGNSRVNSGIDEVVKYVECSDDDYQICPGNSSFLFNESYIVPETSIIDTDVTQEQDINNLFGSNAIWDANHICNKFTIPQLNTGTLNIKVAASSLK